MIHLFSQRNRILFLIPAAVLLSSSLAGVSNAQGIVRSGEALFRQEAKQIPEVMQLPHEEGSNRPIDDFINAQGSTACDAAQFQVHCFYNKPPYSDLPNYAVGWTTGACPGQFCPSYGSSRIAVVDFAGGANTYLMKHGYPSLNTKTSGFIAERPLPDGRAEVTVVLHTTNALTFFSAWDANLPSPPESAETNMRLFGSSVWDLLTDPMHSKPALAESDLVLVFINPKLGAPMPDMVQLFAFGAYPNLQLLGLHFAANAVGTKPDGSPAKASVSQIAVFTTPAVGDGGFVAESDDITP